MLRIINTNATTRTPFNLWVSLAVLILFALTNTAVLAAGSKESRLSDEAFPYLTDDQLPPRTPPLLELGDPFLGEGNLKPGFQILTGAVWQPRFWVYGTLRSALSTHKLGNNSRSGEWANRLDLFGNLQLTGTERLLIGVQPLHRDGNFSGHVFTPDSEDGWNDNSNLRIRALFFEGDISEIFPRWDLLDSTPNDIGFSVGRQDIVFQDGMLISDNLDGVGVTRNSVRFQGVPWLINLRSTFFFGWNEVHRDNNVEDRSAEIYGIFTAIDTLKSTINLDLAYVDSGDSARDDVLSIGLDAIQRIGKFSTTFRLLGSFATDSETPSAGDGALLFGDINWTPAYTNDIAYVTFFAGFDRYTSAARDPLAGGPLGRVGLLFSARGLGSFPAPLSNRAGDAYGGAVGYQFQLAKTRRQLTFEAGVRKDDNNNGADSVGIAGKLQQAFGRRTVFTIEAFGTAHENNQPGAGIRTEILLKL